MKQYNKPPLTYKEQVELLKSRGVKIKDEKRAERHLSNISYYRLSAYMLPYKKKVDKAILDQFKDGTSWEMIYLSMYSTASYAFLYSMLSNG